MATASLALGALGALGAPEGDNQDALASATFAALPVQFFAMFARAMMALRLTRKPWRPAEVGLAAPAQPIPMFGLGVLGGLGFVVIAQLGTWLLPSISEAGAQVAAQVSLGQGWVRDLTIILAMTVAAPLGEELVYRGLIFRGLHDWLGRLGVTTILRVGVPALVSAVIFAISHGGEGQSRQIVFLTVFGLIAAGLLWWTGSLWVPVAGHSVTNVVNVWLLAYGSGAMTLATHPGYLLALVAPFVGVAIVAAGARLLGRPQR